MKTAPDDLPYRGLTAREVEQRVQQGRTNRQPRAVGRTVPQIIASNLFTLFNLLNAVLAAALIAVGAYRNLLFLGVVVSNTVIGTVQELRAKRTVERLRLLSAPQASVIRDGVVTAIPIEEIVADDLFVVSPGDQLCVDAKVISGEGAVNESLLTGESEPVDKAMGSELLSGSYVMEGTLYARATRVGGDSYVAGLTAKARKIKQPNSELMRSMRTIIRMVSIAIVPLGFIQLYKQVALLGRTVDESVVSTVGAVLGMIPEGLMLLTSVALAVGVIRLGQRKTLVQDLYGIESLARVDTLCIDKTGTITEGSMEVIGLQALGDMSRQTAARALGRLVDALGEDNATFHALRNAYGADGDGVRATATVPFSSARKWSAASFADTGAYCVGAAECMLGDALPQALADTIHAHAQNGERVLLLCHSGQPLLDKTLPGALAPVALVYLSDVLRPDAAETIAFLVGEDVRVKVISGDAPATVMHVAKKAGLPDAERAVDARTLDSPEKIEQAAAAYSIFGRVTPDQKQAIVQALKRQGHTVGMMGDGVNDIPAMKASDCAIAMASGSDATRRVAQMTLLDSNFSAVPSIVMEGRRVINNITRAASLFLVKTTFAFLLSLLAVFLPMYYPFAPIQMTLISSFTVGIPSFFLAMAPNKARVKGNFLHNVLRNALPGGLVIVLQIMVMLALSEPMGITEPEQSTIAVWTTGFAALTALVFVCLPMTLRRVCLIVLVSAGFTLGALVFGEVFYLVPLRAPLALLAAGLMAASPPLIWLLRWIIRKLMPRKA